MLVIVRKTFICSVQLEFTYVPVSISRSGLQHIEADVLVASTQHDGLGVLEMCIVLVGNFGILNHADFCPRGFVVRSIGSQNTNLIGSIVPSLLRCTVATTRVFHIESLYLLVKSNLQILGSGSELVLSCTRSI